MATVIRSRRSRTSSFTSSKEPTCRGSSPTGCWKPWRKSWATGSGSTTRCTSASMSRPKFWGAAGWNTPQRKPGYPTIRNQIVLEVTERGIPDTQGVAALEAASRSGVRIALDDVTLSATNLVILSRCTLDMIKTDRSLVDQITPECPCPAWLSGLSALLHATRVAVIAEGVQTEAQAEALRAAGISMAQGYYFSPPISAQQLKTFHSSAADQPSRTTRNTSRRQ